MVSMKYFISANHTNFIRILLRYIKNQATNTIDISNPAEYEIVPDSENPSGANSRYDVVTAVIKAAGISVIQNNFPVWAR